MTLQEWEQHDKDGGKAAFSNVFSTARGDVFIAPFTGQLIHSKSEAILVLGKVLGYLDFPTDKDELLLWQQLAHGVTCWNASAEWANSLPWEAATTLLTRRLNASDASRRSFQRTFGRWTPEDTGDLRIALFLLGSLQEAAHVAHKEQQTR